MQNEASDPKKFQLCQTGIWNHTKNSFGNTTRKCVDARTGYDQFIFLLKFMDGACDELAQLLIFLTQTVNKKLN